MAMKRKIRESFFQRASVRCKLAEVLYFRLGVVGDEPNGKTVILLRVTYFGKTEIGWQRVKSPLY